MQIPTYKRQSVTPQPKNAVMEQPNLASGNAMMAWGDTIANGVPRAAMAVDEAYQAEQDFKFGLAKDDMNANAQQALDGLKDDLNKKDPHDLFMDGSFDDYNEAYENAMAQAKEKSTGKLKGGLKRRADRYWEQLESANRDIARQIYDKAQKEAGAYCAGQDLQEAVADCDQQRANESIDNAVAAGYLDWQTGDEMKKNSKYDIFINGVITGQYFNYEKKDGQTVGINHQVGVDHDADLKMLEEAREELPNDKYNQLKSYVNNLWDVKAQQIADDRGNIYIDYVNKIMDKDPSVTLETIDNEAGLDPVNLKGCMVDYKASLRRLWKQMNPEEKTGGSGKGGKSGKGSGKTTGEKGEKAPSEQEIKNFISLALKRFTSGEIDGDTYMSSVKEMANTDPKAYSASKLIYDQADEILKNLPTDYQNKAKVTMDSIADGLTNLVDKDSDIAPELQLEDLKTDAMAKLLDVIYEYSNKEGRRDEFNKACTDLMAVYTTKALAQQEKLAKEPTKTEQSSIPAALEKMEDIEEYGKLLYFDNIKGENVWLNKKVGNAFENAAQVAATEIGKIMDRDIEWHYSNEKDGELKHQDPTMKVYFTDEYGFKYIIKDKKIYKEGRGDYDEQVWPSKLSELKKQEADREENKKAKNAIKGML